MIPMSPLTSPEQFAQMVAERLRKRIASAHVEYGASRFELFVKGDRGQLIGKVFLGNFYREFLESDLHGQELIMLRACQVIEAPDLAGIDFESRLYPQIKDRWSIEKARLSSVHLPYVELSEHAALLLAYDLPERISYVGSEQLENWQLSFDMALHNASANLYSRTTFEFEQVFDENTGALLFAVSPWRDHYDCGRFVFASEILKLPVQGEHVVFLISPSYMFITGSESDRGLLFALSELRANKADPHALPPFPVLLNRDGYKPFEISPDNSLHHLFEEAQAAYLKGVYADQRQCLFGQFNRLVPGLYICQYDVVPDGYRVGVRTSAVIDQRRLPCLVPQVSQVHFRSGEGPASSASFAAFLSVMADAIQTTDLYPALYRLNRFPSTHELGQMSYLSGELG